MDLLTAFSNFIAQENLFSPGDRLLLAVSGGMDSVVLCQLCHHSGLDFVMAHANFQLRGSESDRDEAFVRQLAEKYGRELLVKKFDTEAYAKSRKVSLQVAARELRYEWFQQLVSSPFPDQPETPIRPQRITETNKDIVPEVNPKPETRSWILTAHHLDDNIETLLMNFFKGTGIAGLRGMLPRQGNIVRPLLFAGREQIAQYASATSLQWVEDSSNLSDKYTRNYFRHQVIPLLEQVYPGALGNLADNIPRFREIEMLYRQSVEQNKKKLLEYRGSEIHIPVLKLKKAEPLQTLVYEIIQQFGFTPQQVTGVIDLLDSGPGKYIRSATHRILKDRNWLIISPLATIPAAYDPALNPGGASTATGALVPGSSSYILIESPAGTIQYPGGTLGLTVQPVSRILTLPTENTSSKPASKNQKPGTRDTKPETASLDASGITFPLLLRPWRTGDYFYPLGMRKKKKLARFFIDNKLSLAAKEKVWVLESDKKIIWVIGYRIDDRFRITNGTQTALVIKAEPGLA